MKGSLDLSKIIEPVCNTYISRSVGFFGRDYGLLKLLKSILEVFLLIVDNSKIICYMAEVFLHFIVKSCPLL